MISQGDITELEVDVIVNAANKSLLGQSLKKLLNRFISI